MSITIHRQTVAGGGVRRDERAERRTDGYVSSWPVRWGQGPPRVVDLPYLLSGSVTILVYRQMGAQIELYRICLLQPLL